MSDNHLKVPIDALFFIRLSGELSTQAGKAKIAGNEQAGATLQGISEAIFETLTSLGDELHSTEKP
jgi:hypothetical protein